MTFYDRGTDFGRNNSNPNQGFYYGGFNIGYDGGGNINGVTADSPDANHTSWVLMNAVSTPFGSLYQGRALSVLPFTRTYDVRGRYTGIGVVDSGGIQSGMQPPVIPRTEMSTAIRTATTDRGVIYMGIAIGSRR
jgi:hypothetical protein